MIAAAPGKLVLSGAYSVLAGAPAIVAAVDRYAVADTARPGERVTDEVRAAIDGGWMRGAAPWFDASALRTRLADGRDVKLGLGSSAAILVASLAASWADEGRALDEGELFRAALAAHRKAQGGGSGVDVAASVHGNVLACRLVTSGAGAPAPAPGELPPLETEPHPLPAGLTLQVFASPVSASTPELVGRVRSFAASSPATYAQILADAAHGAEQALAARTVADFLVGLRAQALALDALGHAAGAPIFTPDVTALGRAAEEEGALFYPSGAGGGDVAIFAGKSPASERFQREAEGLGRFHLPLCVGARGVHFVSTSSPSAA